MDTKQDVVSIQEHYIMHLAVETKKHNIDEFKLITCLLFYILGKTASMQP